MASRKANVFNGADPTATRKRFAGFTEYIGQHSTIREDIKTWFDALELDGYASFGGKP